jgi:Tol biopolymer transport system component
VRALIPMLVLVACSADGPGRNDLTELTSLRVEPAEVDVASVAIGAEPIDFTAFAVFSDGTEQEVDVVEWSVSNRSAGTIDDAGLFSPSASNGGVTWVTARLSGVEGYAVVTVVFQQDILEDEVSPSLFDGPASPVTGKWQYPPDGVNLPRNTPSVHFQWRSMNAEVYRLRFRSAITDTSVYTRDTEWIADPDVWGSIVSTNAGGDLSVELSGAGPDGVFAEAPLTIHVNRLDADGSIIYWAADGNALFEVPYGEEAREFLRPQGFGCLGCHAISSDGKVAATWDGADGRLGIVRAEDPSDYVIGVGASGNANFSSFSPDGSLILVTLQGNIRMIDANTGQNLGIVVTGGNATHIDWSPDGSRIAFTRAVATGGSISDISLPINADSYISVMDWFGGTNFGNERTIADPPGRPPSGYRAYYPAFSPDGEWIAFNVSREDCYDDADSQLWMVDSEGVNPPIRLRNAAPEGVNTNSWPRWGPLPDDDVLWLTFASRRPYGRVTSGSNPQIWVSAIDPVKAESGEDPSFAAFWLPGQNERTGNHIPVWVP